MICCTFLLLLVQIISDIDQVYFDETSVNCSKFELEVSHCLDKANLGKRRKHCQWHVHNVTRSACSYLIIMLNLSVHVHYGTM